MIIVAQKKWRIAVTPREREMCRHEVPCKMTRCDEGAEFSLAILVILFVVLHNTSTPPSQVWPRHS